MNAFEHPITIDGQRARYYDLSGCDLSGCGLSDCGLSDCDISGMRDLNDLSTSALTPAEVSATRQAAHFYGGNGFTLGTYKPLLTALASTFELSALAMRGYWYDAPTTRTLTREQDAAWLIEFLERTQQGPIVGIGHSQGATATALAAAKRPDLFSALYLIEPVTFTKAQSRLFRWLPRALLMRQEPFKSTARKQSRWQSVDAYYQHLRDKPAYRRIVDDHLWIFAEQSLESRSDGGLQLRFAPENELASYFGIPYIDKALMDMAVPYTLIIGKPTIFISDQVRRTWDKFIPDERIVTLSDYGHLLPIEAPERCARVILDRFAHDQ